MEWVTGGISRRWKILSGPSPVLPDFLPDSQGTGGLPGCTGLGCRWWVASTFRPVIMLPPFPRLDQTRSSSSLGPSCVNQMAHGEARASGWKSYPHGPSDHTLVPTDFVENGPHSRGLSGGESSVGSPDRRSPSKGLRRQGVPFRGPFVPSAFARTPPMPAR